MSAATKIGSGRRVIPIKAVKTLDAKIAEALNTARALIGQQHSLVLTLSPSRRAVTRPWSRHASG